MASGKSARAVIGKEGAAGAAAASTPPANRAAVGGWLDGLAVPAADPANGASPAADPNLRVLFEVNDERFRIVDIGPGASNHAGNGKPDEEVARFAVNGSRYALCMPGSLRAKRAVSSEAAAAARTDFLKLLSPRERQIVELICAGRNNEQAASKLGISAHTLGSHLRNVYCKLAVRSRGELVLRCALALARAQSNGAAPPA